MSLAAVFIVLLSPSALAAAGAFITNDQCKQSDEFLWNRSVSISVDCGCPPHFVALRSNRTTASEMCVMLTKGRVWSGGLCGSSGSGEDYYELAVDERIVLNELLRKANVTEFWISVRRDGAYGPPRKKLPGVDWGRPLNLAEDYDVELQQTAGECLLMDIRLNYSKARFDDCNRTYPQLCIYKAKEPLLQLYCEDPAELTTRYSHYQDTCFKIESTQTVNPNASLYEVDSHRKFQLYHALHRRSKLHCDHTVIRSASVSKLQKALASVTPRVSETSVVAILNDGTMALVDTFNCVAYQRQTQNFTQTPQLSLNFDRVHRRLLLTITNGRYLFRERPDRDPGAVCFTDADTDLLKKVKIQRKLWPPPGVRNSPEEPQQIYELKMQGDFPGQYWCEGHAVPNFTLIKSEKIVAQKKDADVHIYAVQIRMRTLERDDFLQKSYLKQLVLGYGDYLDQFEDVRSVVGLLKRMQVMRVEEVDEGRKRLTVLLHVAVKNSERELEDSSGEEEEDLTGALPDDIRKHYRLKFALTAMFTRTSSSEYQFLGINSTDVCLPERFDTDGLTWPAAPIGHTVTPHHHLCLVESTGLPLRRKCIGDRTYGGVWQRLEGDPERCSQAVGAQTLALFRYHSNLEGHIEEVFGEIERVLDDSAVNLIPADVFYLSATVENIRTTLLGNDSSEIAAAGNKSNSYYCGLAGILSRVMDVNASVVFRSQAALNTTNILLDSADAIINQLSVANGSAEFLNSGSSFSCHGRNSLEAPRNGTLLFRTGKLILLVADPQIDDISGIALLRKNDTEDGDFDSYDTRLLTVDESEQDLLTLPNLEIAAFVPRSLLEKIEQLQSGMNENLNATTNATEPLRVVISIYFNDHIFRETTNGTISRANSKIISVTIPGYGSDLPGELPIFLREADANQSSVCGFWDFEPNGDGVEGSKWSFRGCTLAEQVDDVALCRCSHLTSFSRLCSDVQIVENVSVYQVFVGQQNNTVLTVISAIGCALSLLGVAMIFITAILFPSWRTTANANILLQLSFAIAFEMIIFTFDGPDIDYSRPDTKIGCTLLGASFHYIILVTFMWMLVIAYLQFMRFVKVLGRLRPSHCILKATIISWGFPLIPVLIFASYDNTLYHKRDNISDICYPHGIALTYGLLLPIGLVLIANVASFLLIVYNVFRIPDNLTRSLDKSMTLSQLRLSMFLFFLLGLPWIFGMMVAVGAGSIFSYLFCLTAPLQGFIMFVYFILMEPTTRRLWLNKLAEMVGDKPKKNTFNESIKTTTLN